MEPVRREDFPKELWLAMEDWAWSVTWRMPASTTSIISLEGRIRSNRCPHCYDKELPCDSCKRIPQPRRQVDTDLCDFIERAWCNMGSNRVERELLRGYFIWRMSPRRLIMKSGIRRDDFWMLLLRGAQEIYQLARMYHARACAMKKSVPEYSHHESGRAGCLVT